MRTYSTIATAWTATRSLVMVFLVSCMINLEAEAQETVFTLFRDEAAKADELFAKDKFEEARDLFLNLQKKGRGGKEVTLKIARCYYALHQFRETIEWYGRYKSQYQALPPKDVLKLAEAQRAENHYDKAIDLYREYLQLYPEDELVTKKIWRLKNIRFLFEDSIHYSTVPLPINTPHGELCAVPYRQGLVFMSNKPDNVVAGGRAKSSHYKLYYTNTGPDSVLGHRDARSHQPVKFSSALKAKFHEGPVAFYGDGKKMIYTATAAGDSKTLQLFFATWDEDTWRISHAFPYNSDAYSVSHPAINEEGTILYFSSDMSGGHGGKDLYQSTFANGQWTKPRNLGDQINTYNDEVAPFFQGGYLYFASNGHAGIGGMDIFKSLAQSDGFGEAENMGYPVNTRFDDFGLILMADGMHGYLTSNRNKGGLDDDIYELKIDLQAYPLTIQGTLQYKDANWKDSSDIKVLPYAQLFLIDHTRNVIVHRSLSDSSGHFTMDVPYFSQYKIRVIETSKEESIVSLEIPKERKSEHRHQIVIVKDVFRVKHE
ncbi:MAG TPA: hypothetical protein VD816_02455 [Ohtaekwangia sp.]|nr:hypothetical protein [Ohtaekwangia sp.]